MNRTLFFLSVGREKGHLVFHFLAGQCLAAGFHFASVAVAVLNGLGAGEKSAAPLTSSGRYGENLAIIRHLLHHPFRTICIAGLHQAFPSEKSGRLV